MSKSVLSRQTADSLKLLLGILSLLGLTSCGPPPEPHQTTQESVPHPADSAHRMDIAFCLDSTGSMQGLIDEAKARIREIDRTLRSGDPSPSVRFGIVAYRDHDEDYVTRLYDFDPDVGRAELALAGIEAEGGGDDPEHVVAGLRRAVDDLDWDPAADIKFLFLVGDAPPHLDYGEESNIDGVLATAAAKGITIGSLVYGDSMSEAGHAFWREVATHPQLTEGVAGTELGFESMLLMSIRREAARRRTSVVEPNVDLVPSGEESESTEVDDDHGAADAR